MKLTKQEVIDKFENEIETEEEVIKQIKQIWNQKDLDHFDKLMTAVIGGYTYEDLKKAKVIK